MLKLRLKRIGRKRSPSYRLVVILDKTRRNGRSIDEIGYYNPNTKKCIFDIKKLVKWLSYGAKPTQTLRSLLKKSIYKNYYKTLKIN